VTPTVTARTAVEATVTASTAFYAATQDGRRAVEQAFTTVCNHSEIVPR
jgi:hypothetical protein